ncbi:MFS transporter [Pantoea endophytica]|uniref:MFS transporter n=1 Tax=Pantoea endophytica TaxID=92488 RepID=UPI002413A15D|nr:MFS transporter [Pantoea endophytica]
MFRALFSRPELLTFFTMSVLFFICIHGFDAFMAPYMVRLGIEPQTIGMIMGASGLASLCIRFPLSVISDVMKNRKVFMQFALLLPVIAWPLAWMFPAALTFWLAKLACGIAAASWVLYNIIFIRYFRRDDAPAAVALLALAGPIGVFISNAICGAVALWLGSTQAFFVPAIAGCLALLLSLRIREEEDSHKAPHLKACIDSAKRQLADRSIWFIGLLATVVILVPFATRDTLTPIYAQQLGAKAGTLAVLSNIHLLFYGVAVALCSSVFYQRLGLVNTALVGIGLQIISSIFVPLTSNMWLIYLWQGLAGFSFGMAFAVFMSLSVVNTSEHEQTTRMGLFQTIYSCGMFFGPVLMGVLLQHVNVYAGYWVIGGLCLIAGVLTPLAAKRVQQRQLPPAVREASGMLSQDAVK